MEDLTPLPDRSYYSTIHAPYDFTDVTARTETEPMRPEALIYHPRPRLRLDLTGHVD